jgi:hypothetical protein
MDRLLLAGRPQSPEERQVRQLQFTALIERRDTAARNLLRSCIRDKLSGEADVGSPTKPHAHTICGALLVDDDWLSRLGLHGRATPVDFQTGRNGVDLTPSPRVIRTPPHPWWYGLPPAFP